MSEVQAWLDRLGAMSTVELAIFLRVEGVKGYRARPSRCPVAAFLIEKTGCPIGVSTKDIFMWGGPDTWALPASVAFFVQEFDRGCFPSLDAQKASVA